MDKKNGISVKRTGKERIFETGDLQENKSFGIWVCLCTCMSGILRMGGGEIGKQQE